LGKQFTFQIWQKFSGFENFLKVKKIKYTF
jgi:hypothetical protein